MSRYQRVFHARAHLRFGNGTLSEYKIFPAVLFDLGQRPRRLGLDNPQKYNSLAGQRWLMKTWFAERCQSPSGGPCPGLVIGASPLPHIEWPFV
jgi:hypothetical protein